MLTSPDLPDRSPSDLFELADIDKSVSGQRFPFSVHVSTTTHTIILQWGHGADATFRLIDNHPNHGGSNRGRIIDRWTAENALSIRLP